MSLRFDQEFVRYWSGRYLASELGTRELQLLNEIGPTVAQRGYLTSPELGEIGRWKAVRATGYLAKNEPEMVEDVTRVAFAHDSPERLRHRILGLLTGVGDPMASAILTIWKPEAHTVLDYRAVDALQDLAKRGVLGSEAPEGGRGSLPDYWTYLQRY